MKKSAFKEWFLKQYGALPNERKRRVLQRKETELSFAYYQAKSEFEREQRLHDRWQDALYGWNARDSATHSGGSDGTS